MLKFISDTGLSYFAVFLVPFLVTYIAVPQVIYVVREKGLLDIPDFRSSHKEQTPTMGGIAFFLSLVLSFFVIHLFNPRGESISIIAGLSILFFVGVKDDLLNVSPKVKILAQLFAISFLFFNSTIYITSFDGFCGINEIPKIISLVFSLFVGLSIINSYNLIDGINGSASMVGIVIFSLLGYIFFKMGLEYYTMIAVAIIGLLLSFLRFNLSSNKSIFMGDTGSLVIGFIISVFTLKLLSVSPSELLLAGINPASKFVMALALLFMPSFDTSRVIVIRLLKKKKPFSPDRSHVHHLLIDSMGLNHPQASLLLALTSLIVFLVTYCANKYLSVWGVTFVFFIFCITISGSLFYFDRSFSVRKKKWKIKSHYEKKIKSKDKK